MIDYFWEKYFTKTIFYKMFITVYDGINLYIKHLYIALYSFSNVV